MKLDGFPLYVQARDLARWLGTKELEQVGTRAAGAWSELGRDARQLVIQVSLALSFPADRPRHQAAADESIVRIREGMRMAADLGTLTPRGLRYACAELDAIGRMLGGWRKEGRRRKRARLQANAKEVRSVPSPSSR